MSASFTRQEMRLKKSSATSWTCSPAGLQGEKPHCRLQPERGAPARSPAAAPSPAEGRGTWTRSEQRLARLPYRLRLARLPYRLILLPLEKQLCQKLFKSCWPLPSALQIRRSHPAGTPLDCSVSNGQQQLCAHRERGPQPSSCAARGRQWAQAGAGAPSVARTRSRAILLSFPGTAVPSTLHFQSLITSGTILPKTQVAFSLL